MGGIVCRYPILISPDFSICWRVPVNSWAERGLEKEAMIKAMIRIHLMVIPASLEELSVLHGLLNKFQQSQLHVGKPIASGVADANQQE